MDLVIRHGTVVTASDTYKADVGIRGGKVVQLGGSIPAGAREIDASGKLVIPGGVDAHVHLAPVFGTPKADDYVSGTQAAAAGGVTCLIDFACQTEGGSLRSAVETANAFALDKSIVDYSFHLAVCDPNPNAVAELPDIISDGFPSVKLFMHRGRFQARIVEFMHLIAQAGRHNALTTVHCELQPVIDYMTERLLAEGKGHPRFFPFSRPVHTEAAATAEAVSFCLGAEAPVYMVHLSNAQALAITTAARSAGLPVYVETRPVYLYLNEEKYDLPGRESGKYVVYPPLRSAEDQKALWDGLRAGSIQTVATDHSPITTDVKLDPCRTFAEIPAGTPAIQTLVPMTYSEGVAKGRLTPNRWIELVATNPAKLFGLYPEKGTIAVGSDADIVVFDPDHRHTIVGTEMLSRAGHDLFDGFDVQGWPVVTVSRGEIIYEKGRVVGKPGRGKLVRRRRFAGL